ncbi:hypothetical protein M406DRAFT_66691 [Cryphonectria parasitica EP155]|uniref:Uncharacterized protein n=1 Tax=Cryphonectria parasitica (strain ATCC 38755 / EP155) TaxID=660469 RepID=A0A9P4YB63_CRYP1|nr:uncharacterized protein M406DRAFT_66691 [Cryphonectria parasitica EP155]KAF3770272.1 hypothetical protein M406DRAFT_66691 [Cryphonectria parasitica EP155]
MTPFPMRLFHRFARLRRSPSPEPPSQQTLVDDMAQDYNKTDQEVSQGQPQVPSAPPPGPARQDFHPPPGFDLNSLPATTSGNEIDDKEDSYPPPTGMIGNRPIPAEGIWPDQSIDRPQFVPRILSSMHEKCFSLSSTRVYDDTLRCDKCGCRSKLGWMYRCSHEIEARLFESIKDGNQTIQEHFDEIGEIFSQQLNPPVRGATAHQDKLSPLNEMTPSLKASYTSDQLDTILRQHEKAVDTALSDRYGRRIPPAELYPHVVDELDECKTILCPTCGCGGLGEHLSYLSIDGVLKGDIPPTAAVGFGFRAMGGRPVANAGIVKNLGLRDPKAGLLPDQNKDKKGKAVAGSVEGATETSSVAGTAVSLLTNDSKAASVESVGPKTPSDASARTHDSNENFIRFYADAEEEEDEDSTMGNNAQRDEI